MRGDEDHSRRPQSRRLHHLEAVQPRHAHVEEHHLRLERFQLRERLLSVRAATHHLHFRVFREHLLQRRARRRLVVRHGRDRLGHRVSPR
jgi:hypothetical protein